MLLPCAICQTDRHFLVLFILFSFFPFRSGPSVWNVRKDCRDNLVRHTMLGGRDWSTRADAANCHLIGNEWTVSGCNACVAFAAVGSALVHTTYGLS